MICADCSELLLVAHTKLLEIICHGSNILMIALKNTKTYEMAQTHLNGRCWPIVSCVGISYYGERSGLVGRVLDSRLRACGFEPNRRHCVVVLEQDKFILA